VGGLDRDDECEGEPKKIFKKMGTFGKKIKNLEKKSPKLKIWGEVTYGIINQ
jgi:hypothetical protein